MSVPPGIVTGFIDLRSEHRGAAEYAGLGQQLLELDLPTVLYLDRSTPVSAPESTIVIPTTFSDCWLTGLIPQGIALPAGGNPAKDTLEYLICTHQKSRWIADAFAHTDADLVAWIDFGCLHVPGVAPREIAEFYSRLALARRDVITAPSIWGPPTGEIRLDVPAWYFAGGVLIVPRGLAERFAQLVEQAAARLVEAGRLAWEVNTWSIVWRDHPELFTHYACDHNVSLFEAFQP